MDAEFALAEEALAALLKIDREAKLASMAEALADEVATRSGRDPAKILKVLDLISQGKPPSPEDISQVLSP